MFIHTDDKIVNLKNVSHINIIWDEMKIAYNMNYSIELDNRNSKYTSDVGKLVSDYTYERFNDINDMSAKVAEISTCKYVQDKFFQWEGGLFNLDEVSSIKYEAFQNKIIVNLANPVTFNRGRDIGITAKFVYMKFENSEEYNRVNKLLIDSIAQYNFKG